MKTYWWWRYGATHSWSRHQKVSRIGGSVGGPKSRSGRVEEEKNSQPHLGIEPPNPDRKARSQSLYQLSYPGSNINISVCGGRVAVILGLEFNYFNVNSEYVLL
jgi:hypothetical protein